MSAPMLNAKIRCYLSPKAIDAISQMVRGGCDEDVAIALLEQLLPESELYELEEEAEDSHG